MLSFLEVARGRAGRAGRRGRGEGWKGKLGPRSRKLICFLCTPAVPETETTHCPSKRGFNVVKSA